MTPKFKLQPVLDYRQILEDQAKQDLARSLQQEADLLTRLTQEEQDLSELYRDLEEHQRDGIRCEYLLLFQNRISHKVETVARLVEDLERLRRQIDQKRLRLTEAGRDKKLLEKLKEKKRLEFEQESKRRDGIVLDEIAVQFHRR
ncbi:flagellar export protein FliJ [Geoalkalibacter halelectricus]|uniref:Flagellar FliJ protein n=1 Tax=Geoalkalibacter halelectricus TaxID=2847045 RepID=A0ABY5ZIT9_9BACT|nr:flagellar export protein FliJ [Geoalkalibacter halelectricus]MDO3378077.1 flagellar export protein FliJ [Geoalkalibacter halelectricus]UWZ78374.1 flagellar export protein FliJ [Geoalkalibacter halelectricus]